MLENRDLQVLLLDIYKGQNVSVLEGGYDRRVDFMQNFWIWIKTFKQWDGTNVPFRFGNYNKIPETFLLQELKSHEDVWCDKMRWGRDWLWLCTPASAVYSYAVFAFNELVILMVYSYSVWLFPVLCLRLSIQYLSFSWNTVKVLLKGQVTPLRYSLFFF